MKQKFSSLQTNIIKRDVGHEDLATHVLGMGILSEDHKQEVNDAINANKIYNILTNYWSFLDYENLESIADNMCGEVEEMKRYSKEVEEFCKRRVSELPPDSLGNGTNYNGIKS